VLSLTYLSSARVLLDEDQLAELLATSRRNNERTGLTGVLLYHHGSFIQTLEGPEDAVRSTFAVIEADRRHHGTDVVLSDEVEERTFARWAMGYRSLTNAEADALIGRRGHLTAQRPVREDGRPLTPAEVFHRVFRRTAF
jgi:hypothetical protein